MKKGLYITLAWSNIRKDYRFFIPRILSEAGMLGCFYIALTICMDTRLAREHGGQYLRTLMLIGVAVLALLSAVFMFYANTFLMKQRKHEFGLYNVLGLEKKHIGRVLFHETFICSSISIALGLSLGILFYKVCSLLICRLLQGDIPLGFYFITSLTLIPSAAYFVLLDFCTFIAGRISIHKLQPADLLSSRAIGEREPKVKWLMLIMGILCLGSGYLLSVITESPLEALVYFFLAVFLVIIGTYFLFVTGSTFVLKLLKRNDNFYYDKRHMPTVSGLLYRMKQNAIGLASISILATCVLVMISTTSSLYAGYQLTLESNYPKHLYLEASFTDNGDTYEIPTEERERILLEAAAKNCLEVKSLESTEYLMVTYLVRDNVLYSTTGSSNESDLGSVTSLVFITADTYEKLTGDKIELSGRRVALCPISVNSSSAALTGPSFILYGDSYEVDQDLSLFPIRIQMLSDAFNTYGIVLADDSILDDVFNKQRDIYGIDASHFTKRSGIEFDTLPDAEERSEVLCRDINELLNDYVGSISKDYKLYYVIDAIWDARDNLLGMYGTLLFLGILLGTVCIFATVLIIYYKQISEGYEDRARFQIMEKIGMSQAEVRRTINSQVLWVFFLPLIVAGVHLTFAYPMLRRMLKILMLHNDTTFFICTLITYAVFSLVYILIYDGTSKTYYKIVH